MPFAAAIPIAMGLARIVPSILGLLKGSDAQRSAEQVIDIARQVTGHDDATVAIDALKSDPAALVQYKEALLNHVLAMRQEDVKQLDVVNQTIRAELASKDPYNSRWRATFGYCVAYSWFMLFFGIVFSIIWVVVSDPKAMGVVGKAIAEVMGSMVILWGVALPILGVSIKKRSDDKSTAAGLPTEGLLDMFTKKKKK
jgi:hypothetical protein